MKQKVLQVITGEARKDKERQDVCEGDEDGLTKAEEGCRE